jgi:hypothetical protein
MKKKFGVKKFSVLMTALLTVGSTVYANGILPENEEDGIIPDEGSDAVEAFLNRLPSIGPIVANDDLISPPVEVVFNKDNDPIYIKKVVDFKTTGESMAEFLVTVNGVDGEVTTWVANSTEKCKGRGNQADRGVAAADNWSLEVCDTWKKRWVLTTSKEITSIKIEPIIDFEGDDNAAVFDVIKGKGPKISTTGSSNGREISSVEVVEGSFSGSVIATYSRPVHLLGEDEKHDLYGVMTLKFVDDKNEPVPFIGTMTFRADTDDVYLPKGCCCLDFDLAEFEGYDGNFSTSLNNDGNNIHLLPEDGPTTNHIDKFLVCYDRKYPTQLGCEGILNQNRRIWYPKPFGQRAEVKSTHWFVKDEDPYAALWCRELNEEPGLDLPFGVELLAKGVKLEATTNNEGGVDLKLTTDSEQDTAEFRIICGDQLENEGTAITEVPVCIFPSGGSPYTCTDNVVCDNYRVLEIEYTGRPIIYDPVTP